MNADDRIADGNAPAYNASERNPAKVIAVIQVRHEHLEKQVA